MESDEKNSARWKLAGVFALTLGTTGVSVLFNYLGRDFFNSIAAKDQEKFTEMLIKWIAAICAGIPVYVLRDYYQSKLALEWRQWMTERFTADYFYDRTFYQVQAGALVDNPDQRIAVDVRNFTDTTLQFSVVLLNAVVDLVSFSGILYGIYPPLFAALLVYSLGGTALSVAIGRPLVGLNFQQEAQEANFRCDSCFSERLQCT
ncbi:ABC transporter D family member chloroplastic [Micractinium conductrix]|uniref:ABC transporter D family member chloroplastic n=1 Tax=Micractinium conductrix TaxID=554055 RepID=A0A2P6VD24_9CHLO|nr:ABC transporter D family member chloroplastic [Micractinium conductrix]|eukprot:PSC71984.1 ABC transporter D family member chloroplastic [Micractinium conductrix]